MMDDGRDVTWRGRRARLVGFFALCCAAVFGAFGISAIQADEPPVYPTTFTIGGTGTVTPNTLVIAPVQGSAGKTFNNAETALTDPDDPDAAVFLPLDHLGSKTMTLTDTHVTVDRDRLVITLLGSSTDTSTLLSGVDAEVLVIFAWGTANVDQNPDVSTSFKAAPVGGLGSILGSAGIVDGLETGPVVLTMGDGAAYSSLNTEEKPAHLARTKNMTDDAVLFFEGVYFPEGVYDSENLPADRVIEGLPDPVPQLASGGDRTMLATSLALGPLGDLAHAALGVDQNARVAFGGGLGFQLFGEPGEEGQRPGPGDFDPKVTEWSLNAILPSVGLPPGLDGIFETDSSLQWQLELSYKAPDGSGSGGAGTPKPSGEYTFTATAALKTDLISNSDELDTITTILKLSRDPGTGAFKVELSAGLKNWQPFGIDWLPEIAEVKLTGSISRALGADGKLGPIAFAGEFIGEVELFEGTSVRVTIGGSFAKGSFDAHLSIRLIGTIGIGQVGELLTGGVLDLPPELDALQFADLAIDARIGRTPRAGGGTGGSTTTSSTPPTTVPGSTTPRYTYSFKVSAVGAVEIDINGTLLGASGIVIVDKSGITIGARPEELSLQTLLGPRVDVPAALDFALSDPENGYSFGVLFSTVARKIDSTTLGTYPVEVRDFFRPMFGVAEGTTTPFSYDVPNGVGAAGTFGLPAEMAGIVESLGVQSNIRLEGSVPLFGNPAFKLKAALRFQPTQPVCTEVDEEQVRDSSDLLIDDGTVGTEDVFNTAALTTTQSKLDCDKGAPIDFFHAWAVALELSGELSKTKLEARLTGSMTLAFPAGLPPEAAGPLRAGGIPVADWKDVDSADECGPGQTMKAFAGDPGKQRCYDLVKFGVDAAIAVDPEKVFIDLGAFADTSVGGFFYPFGVDWVGFGDFRLELGLTYSYGSAGSVGVRAGFAGNAQLNLPVPGSDTFTKDVFVAASARLQSTTTPVPVVTIVPEGFAFSTAEGLGLSDIATIYNGFKGSLGFVGQGDLIPDLGPAYPHLNFRNLTFALGLVPGGVPSLCIPFGLEITGDLYWGTEFTSRSMNCDTSASAPEAKNNSCLQDRAKGCLISLSLKVSLTEIYGDITLNEFDISTPKIGDVPSYRVIDLDTFRFAVRLSPLTQFVRFEGGGAVMIPNGPEIIDAQLQATLQPLGVDFLGTAQIADSSIRGLISGSASANPFNDPLSIRFDLILAADVDGFFGGSRIQEQLLEPVAEAVRLPLRLASVLAQISADYERDDSIRHLIKRLPSTFEQAGLDVPPLIELLSDEFADFLELIEPVEKYINRTIDKLLNGVDFKDVVPKPLRQFIPDDILDVGFPGICQIFFQDDIFDGFRKDNDRSECDRHKIIPGVVVPLIEEAVRELVGFDVDVQALLDRLAAPPDQGGLDLNTLPFDDLCLVIDVDLSAVDLDARFGAQASAKLYGQPIGIGFEFDLSDFEVGTKPSAVIEMAQKILESFALSTDPGDFNELCDVSPELVELAEPDPPVPAVLTSVELESTVVAEGGELVLTGSFDRALLEPHTLRIDWGTDADGDGLNDVDNVVIPAVELEEGEDPEALPPTTFGSTPDFVHPYVDDDPSRTPSDPIFVRVADLTGVAADAAPLELMVTGRGVNLDPTISLTRLGGGGPIMEGDLVEFELTVSDPGSRDDLFVTIEWGDGDEDELEFPADGTPRTLTVAHRWLDDDPTGSPSDTVNVFARVIDDDNGYACIADDPTATCLPASNSSGDLAAWILPGIEMDVANRAPWDASIVGATLIGHADGTPVPADEIGEPTTSPIEGELYEFEIAFTDVLGDAHTLVIDWGDGTTTAVPAPDDPKLEIEQPDGSVVHLPDLNFSDLTEIELLDADGNVIELLDSGVLPEGVEPAYGRRTVTVTHRWLDDDPTKDPVDRYDVTFEILDDDTGVDTGVLPLEVQNRDPYDLSISEATRVASFAEEPSVVTTDLVEGDRYRFEFAFTDVTADVIGIEVTWGDGTSTIIDDVDASPFTTMDLLPTGTAARRTITLTHRWDDDDPTATMSDVYQVRMRLLDDDTGVGAVARNFVVNDVVPEIVRQGWNAPGYARADGFERPAPVIDELDVAVIDVELADPSRADTHTVVVDWGDGTTADEHLFTPVSFSGDPIDTPLFADNYVPRRFQVTHQYGDNGVFTVTFTVTDDDGLTSTTTTTVTVHNIDPTLELDRDETVPAWPGPTFTTQIGVDNPFAATSYDPGSDDLTFSWDFGDWAGDVETHYRSDDDTPDPYPSPDVDPQTVTDTTSHVYTRACLYTLTVDVVDDDGGEGPQESAPVVVVGLETKRHETGWWGSRYGAQLPEDSKPYSQDEFGCYLEIAEHMSSVMGEVRDVSTFDAAAAVLHGDDMASHDARARLEGVILAAWLNYATGAVGVTPAGKIDLDYMFGIYAVEDIARNPAATDKELERAHQELERLQRRFD